MKKHYLGLILIGSFYFSIACQPKSEETTAAEGQEQSEEKETEQRPSPLLVAEGQAAGKNIKVQVEKDNFESGSDFKISKQEFDDFCKEFLFEQIKGEYKLGEAFCKKYDEPNYVLSILPDHSAKAHIKKFYVK